MGFDGNTCTKAGAAPFNHSVFASSELMQHIDIIEYNIMRNQFEVWFMSGSHMGPKILSVSDKLGKK